MAGGVKQPREYIGECACPLCARPAPVRQQANGWAILKCGFCGAALQAQDIKANALLRNKIVIPAEEKPAPGNFAAVPPSIKKPLPFQPIPETKPDQKPPRSLW